MLHRYYFTITSKLQLKTLDILFKRPFVKILWRKKQQKQLQTTPHYRETSEQTTHSVHSFPRGVMRTFNIHPHHSALHRRTTSRRTRLFTQKNKGTTPWDRGKDSWAGGLRNMTGMFQINCRFQATNSIPAAERIYQIVLSTRLIVNGFLRTWSTEVSLLVGNGTKHVTRDCLHICHLFQLPPNKYLHSCTTRLVSGLLLLLSWSIFKKTLLPLLEIKNALDISLDKRGSPLNGVHNNQPFNRGGWGQSWKTTSTK